MCCRASARQHPVRAAYAVHRVTDRRTLKSASVRPALPTPPSPDFHHRTGIELPGGRRRLARGSSVSALSPRPLLSTPIDELSRPSAAPRAAPLRRTAAAQTRDDAGNASIASSGYKSDTKPYTQSQVATSRTDSPQTIIVRATDIATPGRDSRRRISDEEPAE